MKPVFTMNPTVFDRLDHVLIKYAKYVRKVIATNNGLNTFYTFDKLDYENKLGNLYRELSPSVASIVESSIGDAGLFPKSKNIFQIPKELEDHVIKIKYHKPIFSKKVKVDLTFTTIRSSIEIVTKFEAEYELKN